MPDLVPRDKRVNLVWMGSLDHLESLELQDDLDRKEAWVCQDLMYNISLVINFDFFVIKF